MSRIRLFIVALGAAVALVIPTTATTASEATLLTGSVGPGFTITLKKGATKVRTLKAGTYTIRVSDKSNMHDFKLKGSTRKSITTVGLQGHEDHDREAQQGHGHLLLLSSRFEHEGHLPGHLDPSDVPAVLGGMAGTFFRAVRPRFAGSRSARGRRGRSVGRAALRRSGGARRTPPAPGRA